MPISHHARQSLSLNFRPELGGLYSPRQDRIQSRDQDQTRPVITLSWDGGTAGNLVWTLLLQAGGFWSDTVEPHRVAANMHRVPAEYRQRLYRGNDPTVWDWTLPELPVALLDRELGTLGWRMWVITRASRQSCELALVRHYWSNWRHYLLDPLILARDPTTKASDTVSLHAARAVRQGIIPRVSRLNQLDQEQEVEFCRWLLACHDFDEGNQGLLRPEVQARLKEPGSVELNFLEDIVCRPQSLLDHISSLGLEITDPMRTTLGLWLDHQRKLAKENLIYRELVPWLPDQIGSIDK